MIHNHYNIHRQNSSLYSGNLMKMSTGVGETTAHSAQYQQSASQLRNNNNNGGQNSENNNSNANQQTAANKQQQQQLNLNQQQVSRAEPSVKLIDDLNVNIANENRVVLNVGGIRHETYKVTLLTID